MFKAGFDMGPVLGYVQGYLEYAKRGKGPHRLIVPRPLIRSWTGWRNTVFCESSPVKVATGASGMRTTYSCLTIPRQRIAKQRNDPQAWTLPQCIQRGWLSVSTCVRVVRRETGEGPLPTLPRGTREGFRTTAGVAFKTLQVAENL